MPDFCNLRVGAGVAFKTRELTGWVVVASKAAHGQSPHTFRQIRKKLSDFCHSRKKAWNKEVERQTVVQLNEGREQVCLQVA